MAVDKGWFTLKVEINDGHGGTIKTQAEVEMRNILSVSVLKLNLPQPGSLRNLADRGLEQSHKSGYRPGKWLRRGRRPNLDC